MLITAGCTVPDERGVPPGTAPPPHTCSGCAQAEGHVTVSHHPFTAGWKKQPAFLMRTRPLTEEADFIWKSRGNTDKADVADTAHRKLFKSIGNYYTSSHERDFQIYEIFEILKQSKASIKDLCLWPAYCLLNTPTPTVQLLRVCLPIKVFLLLQHINMLRLQASAEECSLQVQWFGEIEQPVSRMPKPRPSIK